MALIYITGIAGSGKSAVQAELKNHGYEAIDVDDPELSGAFNNQSGKIVQIPEVNDRTEEWFDDHSWRTRPGAIAKLKHEAKNKTIFLCGVAEKDPLWVDAYDQLICLDIDEQTLRDRIANRRDNDFGKSAKELEIILKQHKTTTQRYREKGAHVIDATQKLEDVVGQILDFVES